MGSSLDAQIRKAFRRREYSGSTVASFGRIWLRWLPPVLRPARSADCRPARTSPGTLLMTEETVRATPGRQTFAATRTPPAV